MFYFTLFVVKRGENKLTADLIVSVSTKARVPMHTNIVYCCNSYIYLLSFFSPEGVPGKG